jgi:hypothetical protein
MPRADDSGVAALPVAPGLVQRTRGLVRWICTKNPFYVSSALCMLVGLWISFGAQVRAQETWALMLGMSGYTLLPAVPTVLLVRYGGVWEDVRTVLLLVVLMFLATSVTFDEALARTPVLGMACYIGGFLFALGLSAAMLEGVRLVLPGWFAATYYLSLALFFLYPVALAPLVDRPRSEALQWALFGFSPAAGLVALTLLPAIRRGPEGGCGRTGGPSSHLLGTMSGSQSVGDPEPGSPSPRAGYESGQCGHSASRLSFRPTPRSRSGS